MRRRTSGLATAAVLAGVAGTGGLIATGGGPAPALAAPPAPAHTATVQRTTLTAMVSEPAILAYRARSDGSPYVVINQRRGTYTELPTVGQIIAPGHVVYRVNDAPVVLLSGSTPAYRALSTGASGPDVAELNADLVALGDGSAAQLHPGSASFSAATTSAVKKLQAGLGVAQTGTLALGQAVFEPTTVRVTSLSAALGGAAQTGQTVLLATSTARQVQVALDASQQAELAVGDTVTITLPDRRTTPGVVASVATVATCPPGPGGSGSGSAPPGTDSCPSTGSGTATPTIAVDVTCSDPAATGTWDQAPVQVGITTARVPGALVVPVNALLAQSGGGYAVQVIGTGARDHLVPVSLGLFDDADGLVAVTAPGLAAGQRVVVPSS